MDEDPLSDWGLKPVELADQPTIMPYFNSLRNPLSDFTFSQLFTWRNSLRILWTTLHGNLCVFANGAGDLTLLMPPIGEGNTDHALSTAFELMDDYNVGHGVPDRSRVEYASEELLLRFDSANLISQPMGADYVYDIQRMIDLAGGDLSSKRQAKNRFLRNYQFRVEPYDPARHLEPCRKLLDNWKIHQDASHLEEPNASAIKRQKESLATDLTLQYSRELGLEGMVVFIDSANGEAPPAFTPGLRAFTFGEYLGTDQSSITIEKTDLEIKGLAQYIFSAFCENNWSDRPLVNVGDDWGLESLAWTKMSYRPVKMQRKFTLRKSPVVKVAIPAVDVTFDRGAPTLAPAEVRVRPAKRMDLAAVASLERECFSSYPLNKRQLQYLQQRQSAIFLIAERDGQLLGDGICLVRQHKRRQVNCGISGRIYSLAVRAEQRGRHIGQQLLAAMVAELSARGARRIYLEVESTNAAALKLYERNGFVKIGMLPNYYGPDTSAIHMMREMMPAPQLATPMIAR